MGRFSGWITHSDPAVPVELQTASSQMPTLLDALNAKSGMLAKGACTF